MIALLVIVYFLGVLLCFGKMWIGFMLCYGALLTGIVLWWKEEI